MRLWHIDLIPYLPKSQLIAQWRELNSIFKKQDNHILINYIYNYDKTYLLTYTMIVKNEMHNRDICIRNLDNFMEYFKDCHGYNTCKERFIEHNNEYLTICYYNLKEKHIRGQKDFTKEIWNKLHKFYKEMIENE